MSAVAVVVRADGQGLTAAGERILAESAETLVKVIRLLRARENPPSIVHVEPAIWDLLAVAGRENLAGFSLPVSRSDVWVMFDGFQVRPAMGD